VTFGIIVLAIMVCGGFWGYFSEKKRWNGGICARCGTPWKSFGMDSQGGRGYNCGCPKFQNGIWISWPGIDKKQLTQAPPGTFQVWEEEELLLVTKWNMT